MLIRSSLHYSNTNTILLTVPGGKKVLSRLLNDLIAFALLLYLQGQVTMTGLRRMFVTCNLLAGVLNTPSVPDLSCLCPALQDIVKPLSKTKWELEDQLPKCQLPS